MVNTCDTLTNHMAVSECCMWFEYTLDYLGASIVDQTIQTMKIEEGKVDSSHDPVQAKQARIRIVALEVLSSFRCGVNCTRAGKVPFASTGPNGQVVKAPVS